MAAECTQVEPLLSALLDDELDGEEAVIAVDHLGRCPACRTELEQLAVLRSMVRSMPVRRLPEGVRFAPAPPPAPASRPLARAGADGQRGAGLVTGAAFALGGQPTGEGPIVAVPVEVYVADHLVHTVNRAAWMPAGLELDR
jgi:anti-sigma factor RsiW